MNKKIFLSLVGLTVSVSSVQAETSPWALPLTINDQNTKVAFDVDTTWHVVYGKVSGLSGNVALSDASNMMSVTSDIHIPVKTFDTGWGLRNDSLMEHMQAEKFPEVVLKTSALEGTCTKEGLSKEPCKGKLKASLTICDVTKDVPLDVTIEDKGDTYKVSGDYAFKWMDYNVKDPSIIAAKVDPTVRIQYSVDVPKAK
jgi:polyisoprenoid-binding protein YceI